MPRTETMAEVLLKLAENLPDTFDIEDLVVEAYKTHPERFGLRKYPYPDNNKVIAALSGKWGMVSLKLLDKIAPRTLRISHYGRKTLKKLKGEDDQHLITLEHQSILLSALLHDTMYLYGSGQKECIHDKEAVSFLQTNVNKVAKSVLPLVADRDIEFDSGFQLTKKTLESLIDCVAYLKAKYPRQLKEY